MEPKIYTCDTLKKTNLVRYNPVLSGFKKSRSVWVDIFRECFRKDENWRWIKSDRLIEFQVGLKCQDRNERKWLRFNMENV